MLYAVLCPSQFSDRREEAAFLHDLGERLLFQVVKLEYGLKREDVSLCRGLYGKPYFSGFPVHFSVSHCSGLVCCAVSNREVGVDVEPIRPYRPRLARRICTEEELSFLRQAPDRSMALTVLWTLKESRMKLSGEGLHFGFRNAAFSFSEGIALCGEPQIRAKCYTSVSGFVLSLCGEGELPESPILLGMHQLF